MTIAVDWDVNQLNKQTCTSFELNIGEICTKFAFLRISGPKVMQFIMLA